MDGWLQLFGEINEHLKEGMTATAPSKKTSILYKKMDPTVTRIKHSPANIRLDEDVFKTSWSRPIYSSWSYVFKTSLRRFQDVFKTSFPDILKTSSKRLQDALKKYLQDVFKTYHQLKLFSLTSLRNLFNTLLRRTAQTVIYRRICLGHTSEKFMGSVQNLQEW